ncbi:Eco57I restriction-modification methylase domain-containing protein [Desulfovirgula thermocuniculi]|uniref:Eco57I restriction-modification methylase domain-containing protein n=1 Tax=Desulfovirgula thermocuniculi TaxID=348842 RepID=UPI00041C1105|nr:DNA methyltransferase [Desulfovirgula thermocuniculi]
MTFRHLRNVRGFFSDYYLGSVFGRGAGRGGRRTLSDRETDLAYARFRRIRERAEGRAADALTCRERFVRPLLRDVLGFHLGAGENGIHRLFPSAEAEAAGEPPLLLVYCGAWDEDLGAGRGKANSMRALGEALAREGVSYGFLVTGERMRLIRAPGEGPQAAYLEVDLAGLDEEEDPESFAAFLKLFSVATFLPGKDGRRPIEEIERESREHAERVSEDLKGAVFRAAESMVSGLIADAVARGELASPLELNEARLRTYRDAALLALYRILFILYAEARDPRLNEHPLYWKSYSATGLLEEILARPDRIWPENRSFLWERLRALFRIYDEGLPAITPWDHIPPRGGDFFSRTTPEGQILDRARLPDRQVAQLMLDLATTPPRRGIGRERVSFRELDIESLGAVYEGLLEYEPRIAREVSLEVRIKGREYVLPPAELVRLCEQKNLRLVGNVALVRGTEAERLHPDASVDESEDENDDASETAAETDLAEAEGEAVNEEAEEGVAKGATVRLVRRLEPGTFHFVPGPGRKGSGSFYTPRVLVRDLVRHTLGPLIEGKSAAEIERLRVLDPACGSGHFLVEAMRFLGHALHRAYVEEYGGKAPPEFRSTTGQGWDTNWRASDEEARAANSEARAWCKRRIAERCLFGVDLNPTAVQLAQVALWIESLAGDRPLTYFRHHIRCGNSLLGTRMDRLEEPPLPAKGFNRQQLRLFQEPVRQAIRKAARLRRLIDEVRPEDLLREGIQPESTEEQRYKEDLRKQADSILAAAKLLFDLRSASAFVPEIWREWDTLTSLIEKPDELHTYARGRPWWSEFERVRERERFFHWELEFPEVFVDAERPGFDAVLGNPPFLGGLKIRGVLGPVYRTLLEAEYEPFKGTADLCAAFFRRAFQLLRPGGTMAMVATNTIGQGDTRESGLAVIVRQGGTITFARRFIKWPGAANVEVNLVAIHKPDQSPSAHRPLPLLDGQPVEFISSRLDADPEAEPRRLPQNEGKAFIGDYVRGIGFVLEPEEAERLVAKNPRNADCLFPYLSGEDLNSDPEQRPSRYVICFHDWDLARARQYPDLLRTVEERVKPERERLRGPGDKRNREYWWQFGAYRSGLRATIAPLRRVLVRAEVSQLHMLTFVPKDWIYSHMLIVFAFQDDYHFALLQSSMHELWLRKQASSLRTDVRYTPTDCFDTFPFPPQEYRTSSLEDLLQRPAFAHAARIGAEYHEHRRQIMLARNLGLTKTYNLFHDPNCSDDDIARLRELHVAMDLAVLACYGWDDLALEHGFYPNDRGQVRFSIAPQARREMLNRLLELNLYLSGREWKREVESAKVYAIPAVGLARAAETSEAYVTGPARQSASTAFQQAAVLAWVVHKLYSPGYPVSRFRVQKMLYLVEAATGTGLFTEFRKQAAGPYDPGLRYRGPEDIAVRQRRWLVARGETHFEPGPNIEEALRYAPRYLDEVLAELVLEEFRGFRDETLERWTTVHLAAVELQRQGQPVTPETIVAYIQSVAEWQPKLSREEFAPDRVADALEGLRNTGLMATQRRDT